MLRTPVALNIFTRADTALRVLERIAMARPARLYLIADGPRPDRAGEAEACAAARQRVLDRIDWGAQVITRFAPVNLGNRRCLSEGYAWVFEREERAILLEDDCLPEPTFFGFCEELLDRYADDARVMTIGGDNFQFGRKATDDSYYFSRYHHLWGFATWRRAWQLYDPDIKLWPALRPTSWLLDVVENPWGARYWTDVFDRIWNRQFDVWDAQWGFAAWANSTLGIIPADNLISNIGFGASGTTTKDTKSPVAELPTVPMTFPLRHPIAMIRNREADHVTFAKIFPRVIPSRYRRLRMAVSRRTPAMLRRWIKKLTQHIP